MKTESSDQTKTIRVINERYALFPRDDRIGRPAIHAVLAEVPGHGKLAKWTIRGRFGEDLFGIARVFDEPGKDPEVLVSPRDPFDELYARLERDQNDPHRRLTPMEPTQLDRDRQRFAEMFPALADHLGLADIKLAQVFDPGTVWRCAAHDPKVGEIEWGKYRGLFASGSSWGRFGRYDPAAMADQVTLWTIALADQAKKNTYAIHVGCGVVRAEYEVEGRPNVTVLAETALGARPNFTILSARAANP